MSAKPAGKPADAAQQKKKETILDLTKHMDKEVRVKFNGGREGIYAWRSPVECTLHLTLFILPEHAG
jgi:hypothetical protein